MEALCKEGHRKLDEEKMDQGVTKSSETDQLIPKKASEDEHKVATDSELKATEETQDISKPTETDDSEPKKDETDLAAKSSL